MDTFEKRMQQASEEVRQTTRTLSPPPLHGRHARHAPSRGLLVFAGAFALVVLAVGVLPLLDRDPEGGPVASPDTTVAPVTTTPSTTVPVTCSATGVTASLEQPGLPDQVADVRQAIIEAAMACDFDALVALAGDRFTTSFGGGGAEMLREWEDRGEGKLGILLQILDMTVRVSESGDGITYYVWPAAFGYEHWEDIPAEYVEEVRAIHTDEELEQFSEFGGYAGWRTGISSDGDWMFFVAGD